MIPNTVRDFIKYAAESDESDSSSEDKDKKSKDSKSKSSIIPEFIRKWWDGPEIDDTAYNILSSRLADVYGVPKLKEQKYVPTTFKVRKGFNDAYGPGLSDQDVMWPITINPYSIYNTRKAEKYGIKVDPTDMASSSILLGNAASRYKTNFHGNDYISPFTKVMKEVGFIPTGIRRAMDYHESWNALKESYKDHPEVLKDLAYLRNRAAQAQFKMDLADIIPRYGGGILGAYLMWKYGKPIKKWLLRKWPVTARVADVLGIGGGFLAGSALSLLLTKSLRNGYNRQAASLREDPNYKYYNERVKKRIEEIGR